MRKEYKVITTPSGEEVIQYEENGVLYTIPKDPANSDYQEYLNPDKVEHLTETIPTDEA